MKKLSLLIGLLAGCGVSSYEEDPAAGDEAAIAGGAESIGLPSVVRIKMGGLLDRNFCTGTVIAPHVVLTAAHCVTKETNGSFAVRPAESFELIVSPLGKGNGLPVKAVHVAPAFGYARVAVDTVDEALANEHVTMMFNDAALLVTEAELPVAPMRLQLEALDDASLGREVLRRVGYGMTAEGSFGGKKREGFGRLITRLANDDRQNYFAANDEVGVCPGDSGGPVLIERGGEELVLGVTSSGIRPEGDTSPCGKVGSVTDLMPIANWLRARIDEVDPNFRQQARYANTQQLATSFSQSIVVGLPKTYTLPHVAPGTKVRITLDGTGFLDLTMRVGASATTAVFDCRSDAFGADETCEVMTPNTGAPSTVYVAIAGTGSYTLNAAWVDAAYPAVAP